MHSQSKLDQRKRARGAVKDLLLKAGTYYLQALEVCDRLTMTGDLSDRELLMMRSRLYMNLGLVYEIQEEDLRSAREFTEKALRILKYAPPPFLQTCR